MINTPTEQTLGTRLVMSEQTMSAEEPGATTETEPEKKTVAAARTTKSKKSPPKRPMSHRSPPKNRLPKKRLPTGKRTDVPEAHFGSEPVALRPIDTVIHRHNAHGFAARGRFR